MARQTKRLTDRRIASLKETKRHSDGNNLYLVIDKSASGLSKRWTFMFAFAGRQREQGLGSYPQVSLAKARVLAAESRSLLDAGKDPLDAKKAASAAAKAVASRPTFGACAAEYFKTKKQNWRNEAHTRQWFRNLETYCQPIWDMSVADVDTGAVLSVLQPLWVRIPEAAKRQRGRIENVLDAAKVKGHRSGENPAAWRGHLKMILPSRSKGSHPHYAALGYHDVPAFIAKLREKATMHAACLEFIILTASRQGEAIGARWDEIDLASRTWTIPAGRMKSSVEHRVPLCTRALELIEKQAAIRSSGFVFHGMKAGKPLSPATVRRLAPEGGTVHGFRSSFRDWCGNETSFPREVAEGCLAHASGDATEQAYRRGDALEKRRTLMEAWSNYCEPAGAGNVVVPIRAAQ
jgi:integrase